MAFNILTPRINAIETLTTWLRDVKSSGTAGGTLTSGSYQTRTLNTQVGDTTFCSLTNGTTGTDGTANRFTLTAGTYNIEASAAGRLVNRHKIKLRNITDSTDSIIGTSEEAVAGNNANCRSFLNGIIILTSTKTFELQHRGETTAATNGFGIASGFGEVEIYAQIKITKIGS